MRLGMLLLEGPCLVLCEAVVQQCQREAVKRIYGENGSENT